jgi:hypothetical protein
MNKVEEKHQQYRRKCRLVIDRKRIFLFVQMNEKIKKGVFLGLQLQVSSSCKWSRFIRSKPEAETYSAKPENNFVF